jgi:TonB family protein
MRTTRWGLLAVLLFAARTAPAIPGDRQEAVKWHRYVSCALARYRVVDSRNVEDNLEAIVSVRLNADGSVESASLLHSSGNDAWDAAVRRAIAAASPLPPAPASAKRPITRVDMHFRPKPRGGDTDGIRDTSRWSVKHCRLSGSLTTCG